MLIHESKDYLRKCLKEIREVAKHERELVFNDKTQIFPLSQGVDYLGWHFYLTDTGKVIRKLRTSNKRRIKRRYRKLVKQYEAGEKTPEDIRQSLVSYIGHLKHGHTNALRKNLNLKLVLKRERRAIETTKGGTER